MSDHDKRYDAAIRQKAARLYDQGKSVRAVAKAIGRSVSRTHDLLVDAGVELRPVGQHNHKRKGK